MKRALLYCHRIAKVLPKPEFIGQMEKTATLLLLLEDNFQQNKVKKRKKEEKKNTRKQGLLKGSSKINRGLDKGVALYCSFSTILVFL